MMRIRILPLLVAVLVSFSSQARSAENAGQEDLNQATELQLTAKSLADVEKVIALCESALQKGLDDANTRYAKQLLVSALWQRASRLTNAILERPGARRGWQSIWQMALRDLDKLLKHDDKFADAYLLRAKLHSLPGGNRGEARKAVDKAIELFKGNAKQRAAALIVRSDLQEDAGKQLEDLNAAVEADPASTDAWQARAAYHVAHDDLQKAVGDFEKLLANDPKNVGARQAIAEALINLEKYDLALEHANKAIAAAPDFSLNYTLRAQVYEAQGKTKEAFADLDKALTMEPRNLLALLMRARLHFVQEELPAARADVDRLLELQPGMTRAILLRSMIYAALERFQDAIADIRMLLREDPKNVELRLQLASLYVADKRPRKAIELLTEILNDDKDNWMALRARGDALLSIGKHAEAIKDYNVAVKLKPDDHGILNNLAWVLATSPVDALRDGKRSIELGTKACEVTKYEMPHILSTLAAGYAETGDFETAIKWSTKAVELGRDKLKDQLEQLKKELEGYKRREKFRELQKVEEKPDPPRSLIET
jgi:tetratricopeptide (TPR) repeat protein